MNTYYEVAVKYGDAETGQGQYETRLETESLEEARKCFEDCKLELDAFEDAIEVGIYENGEIAIEAEIK